MNQQVHHHKGLRYLFHRRRVTRALALGIFILAAAPALADHVQQPTPVVGDTATYIIKATGSGMLTIPGMDNGMPLDLIGEIKLSRCILAVSPDQSVTTEQRTISQSIRLSGAEILTGENPTLTICTDPHGKITNLRVTGNLALHLSNPALMQAELQQWTLVNREYTPGETFHAPLLLQPSASVSKGTGSPSSEPLRIQTYTGMKTIEGTSVMQFVSKLPAPFTITPRIPPKMGGFTVTSITLKSLSQTANYDPTTGLLVSSQTTANFLMKLSLASANNFVMDAKLPMLISVHRISNASNDTNTPNPTTIPITPQANPVTDH